MEPLRVALKEWAVVCRALAGGRQAVLLRKGGIAEPGGVFRVEHPRFWLYPTWVHQQESGIVPEMRPLVEAVQQDRPAAGVVRLEHFAEVPCVYHVDEREKALALAGLHGWSQETVEARFVYRRPGLFVVPVRVYRAAAVELPEAVAYAGCKSWVDLGRDVPTAAAAPVMGEEAFDAVLNRIDRILQSRAVV
jgi:hypothetical protein